VEAEQVSLDMKDAKEHKSPDFLKVNPFGKVPAMSDGDFNLVRGRGGGGGVGLGLGGECAGWRGEGLEARGWRGGRRAPLAGARPAGGGRPCGAPTPARKSPPAFRCPNRHPRSQFESGALLLYLADKFPLQSGILTPQQRAAAAQWVLFANSTLAK
jgi:hypothetical protein